MGVIINRSHVYRMCIYCCIGAAYILVAYRWMLN